MKRIFDVVFASFSLIILSPLLVLISITNLILLGPPVLFRQQRPGLNGKPFIIYKFRTMTEEKDNHAQYLHDRERMTSYGRMLRRFSLDELPQLFNVVNGDLSIVGPRPLLMEYLELYSPDQARRHEVKPGITGWAQVNGRNALSWEEKFELDVWYADHQSFQLDLTILWKTLVKVIKGEGISYYGELTMNKFKGNK